VKLIEYAKPTRHPQTRIELGEWMADVDSILAPFILALWREGIETVFSCQDAVDFGRPGRAVVGFAKLSDAQRVGRRVHGEVVSFDYESDDVRGAAAEQYTGTAPDAAVFWRRSDATIRPKRSR
jgi:hypothetical protein